jgi:hypothetical protein
VFSTRTFPCPNCRRVTDDGLPRCRHCSASFSPEEVETAAALQGKVNQACSDAGYLKTASLALYLLLGLSLIPFVGGPLFFGFFGALVVLLIMFVRWQIKFGRLRTHDPDYTRAKQTRNLALLLWAFALPLGFALRLLAMIISELTFKYLLY